MGYWDTVYLLSVICGLSAVLYVTIRFRKVGFMKKISEKHKVLSWVAALIPSVICWSFAVINIWTGLIISLHLFATWLVTDIVALIIKKIFKMQEHYNIVSGFAIVMTTVWLIIGWHNAYNVRMTVYDFDTSKNIGQITIATVADTHLGITLDGDSFSEKMKTLQKKKPDIVLILGDFVDDDSKKDDMVKACAALGKLKTKYGIYFVYGNHDVGYMDYRDFTAEDLEAELTKNNVRVLKDENVLINNKFYISGRLDRSFPERMSAEELLKDIDHSKYIILADHQPNDYDNEVAAGADLVISGHTHGGHLLPVGIVSNMLKLNDLLYGTEKIEDTNFVVSSGISGWGVPFKTGTESEITICKVRTRKQTAE